MSTDHGRRQRLNGPLPATAGESVPATGASCLGAARKKPGSFHATFLTHPSGCGEVHEPTFAYPPPPPVLTIAGIRSALERYRPPPDAAPFTAEWRNASVAMALAGEDGGLETCFILRTERRGDPWSGQVALPGGRAGPGDADAAAVAERETWEEIGLRLSRDQCLGALPVQPLYRVAPSGSLSPFVYHLGPHFTRDGAAGWRAALNHEVSEVFWVPLRHLFDRRAVTEIEWIRPGRPETIHAGIEFEGRVIWGLTLRVLGTFADLLGKPLPALAS